MASVGLNLLFTLPVTLVEAVLAKFLAGWAFLCIAIILTFPMALTVNFLGEPDNGVIVAGYVGSMFMAGSYLAVTCLTSALTKNQVISFILSVIVCFVMVLVGWGVFTDVLSSLLPVQVLDFIASIGFMTHFQGISRGLIDSRNVIYFVSVIVVALTLNGLVLEAKKAQ
jgi:ABC-2 type transport system permease protein